jgi:hypothetical protein
MNVASFGPMYLLPHVAGITSQFETVAQAMPVLATTASLTGAPDPSAENRIELP